LTQNLIHKFGGETNKRKFEYSKLQENFDQNFTAHKVCSGRPLEGFLNLDQRHETCGRLETDGHFLAGR
jgi:hypothetical protein